MGIIVRQSAKSSIILLAGVLVGAVSTLFIYPLSLAFYGKLRFILSTTSLMLPFLNLGLGAVAIKFFPEFRTSDSKTNHGFLGFLFLVQLVGLILISALLWLFSTELFTAVWLLKLDPDVFFDHKYQIYALIVLTCFISIMNGYLASHNRIVVPTLFTTLSNKIFIPCLVLLYVALGSGQEWLTWLLVGFKFVVALGLLVYLWSLRVLFLKIDWSFLTRSRKKAILDYAGIGIIGSIGGLIVFRIDTVMIAAMTSDFVKTGIYSIALFIAGIMTIPSTSVLRLLGVRVAEHFQQDEYAKIAVVYKRASLVLMTLGLVIFLPIYFNLEDLFGFLPKTEELKTGISVVLYLGVARLIHMTTALNGQIISYSAYYRWNLLFVLLVGLLTVIFNLWLIPKYGINGAAIASLLSLSFLNILKSLFIWFVFKMQPFQIETAYILGLAGLSTLVLQIPLSLGPVVNIILRCGVIAATFVLPLYYWKLSPDFNYIVDIGLKRIKTQKNSESH